MTCVILTTIHRVATDGAAFGTVWQNSMQRNVAEAEEPLLGLTVTLVVIMKRMNLSVLLPRFFALLSVNACHFSCTIKKKKKQCLLCAVCLWIRCLCLTSTQKKEDALQSQRQSVVVFCQRQPSNTQLIRE